MSAKGQFEQVQADLEAEIAQREEVERRLHDAEASLALAAELGGLGSYVWEVPSRRIHWSDEHFRLHGYQPGEIEPTYEEVIRRIHADDLRDLESAIDVARDRGTDFVATYRVTWPNGEIRTLETRGRFSYGPDGAPLRLHGVVRTFSVRSSDADFLRVGLDAPAAAGVGIWEIDLRSQRASLSPEFGRIHGLSQSNYSLEEMFQLVPEDQRPAVEEAIGTAVETGAGFDLVHQIRREDNGGLLWVHGRGRAVRDENQEIIGLVGTSQDVTERHEAVVALHKSEALFRLLAKASPDIVFRADVEGRATFVNDEQWTALTGLEAGSWAGEGWSVPIHPDDQEETLADWRENVARRGPWEYEFRWVHVNGTESSLLVRALPTISDEGELTGYVGTATDITELRSSEFDRRNLQRALEQAQRLEAVGTLASGVAHDFNNQLAAIQGFVDLALAELPSDSRSSEHLANVKRATEQAQGVTDGLLTFARKRDPERRPFLLNTLVAESFSLLRKLVPAVITMTDEVTEVPVWINGDASQVRQVLANLVVNARDALPRGGRIRLRLSQEEDETGNVAVLRIADNGAGMSEEVAGRAFEPFFTTKPPGRGTGLGLAVIHGIVASHDGAINIDSEVGRGTTIELRLPVVSAPTAETPPEEPVSNVDEARQILIVEDNDLVRRMLVAVAKNAGYRVIEASNGISATNVVAGLEESIDLALLDVDLPGIDGVGCAEKLREKYAALPVVYLTGNPNSDALSRARPTDSVHAKPLGVRDLLRVIATALEPGSRLAD